MGFGERQNKACKTDLFLIMDQCIKKLSEISEIVNFLFWVISYVQENN
jgi:hypothetical protein